MPSTPSMPPTSAAWPTDAAPPARRLPPGCAAPTGAAGPEGWAGVVGVVVIEVETLRGLLYAPGTVTRRTADAALQQALAQWSQAHYLYALAHRHGSVKGQIAEAYELRDAADKALAAAWQDYTHTRGLSLWSRCRSWALPLPWPWPRTSSISISTSPSGPSRTDGNTPPVASGDGGRCD